MVYNRVAMLLKSSRESETSSKNLYILILDMVMIVSLVHFLLKSSWTLPDDSELASNKTNSHSFPASIDLRRLTTPSNLTFLSNIEYIYDPPHSVPGYLNLPSFRLPCRATVKTASCLLIQSSLIHAPLVSRTTPA